MTVTYVPVPSERVLSIDPATFGFGYVVIEYDPVRLVAWGTKTCRRKDGTAAAAVSRLIREYQPTAIVLPSWGAGDHPFRGPALDAFIEAVEGALTLQETPVLMCSPENVREHFGAIGARTKYSIAKLFADRFPELRAVLPRPRSTAETERAAMSVFDALAITYTVFRLGGPPTD